MALYDQHLHSWHSNDSAADPADNVRRAIELGLGGITFTEHYDTHPTEWALCKYNYTRIAESIARLRDQFGDRLFIGHGIEICWQPENLPMLMDYIERHRFDVVILSVHWFAGMALHVREHWGTMDAREATRAYLNTVLQAVHKVGELRNEGRRPFDVLGHLDLVKRYTNRYFSQFDVESESGLVDEILQGCLAAELLPEVNLSSLRQSLPEAMPGEWVVRRYAELGGRAIPLGSDAHKSQDIGAGLEAGAAMLRRCGIKSLAVFKERQCFEEPL